VPSDDKDGADGADQRRLDSGPLRQDIRSSLYLYQDGYGAVMA
jgi:hypothetical protein